MDIGTAKPIAAQRARVPHHLIDIVDPTDATRPRASAPMRTPRSRRSARAARLPILVGGTMLYFKALSEGLSALPPADAAVRAALDARRRAGRLAGAARRARARRSGDGRAPRADRRAAHPARARGASTLTGTPLSALQGRRAAGARCGPLRVALVPPDRARAARAIAARFDAMLAAGLVDELAALRARHALTPALPSMRSVGYRQAWEYLDGEIDRDALRARGIAATRQLAKRQFTWLRTTGAAFDAHAAHRRDRARIVAAIA